MEQLKEDLSLLGRWGSDSDSARFQKCFFCLTWLAQGEGSGREKQKGEGNGGRFLKKINFFQEAEAVFFKKPVFF